MFNTFLLVYFRTFWLGSRYVLFLTYFFTFGLFAPEISSFSKTKVTTPKHYPQQPTFFSQGDRSNCLIFAIICLRLRGP